MTNFEKYFKNASIDDAVNFIYPPGDDPAELWCPSYNSPDGCFAMKEDNGWICMDCFRKWLLQDANDDGK